MPPAPLPTIPTDWATILSRIFSHTTFVPSDVGTGSNTAIAAELIYSDGSNCCGIAGGPF